MKEISSKKTKFSFEEKYFTVASRILEFSPLFLVLASLKPPSHRSSPKLPHNPAKILNFNSNIYSTKFPS